MILGIETSTDICGVALVKGGQCRLALSLHRPREHSSVLLPLVDDLLKQAGVRPEQIEGLAVTMGPGSFTGLRVGMGLAKGLAMGWRKPLVGVETLRVIAARLTVDESTGECSVIDAKRGEVYSSVFRLQEGVWQDIKKGTCETAESLAAWIVAHQQDGPLVVTGSGVPMMREFLKPYPWVSFTPEVQWVPLAKTVAKLGEILVEKGNFPPASSLVPLYMREPPITLKKVKELRHG